jgi:hypothetical protein
MQSRTQHEQRIAATEGDSEHALANELRILRDVFRMLPTGVTVQDEQGRFLLVNNPERLQCRKLRESPKGLRSRKLSARQNRLARIVNRATVPIDARLLHRRTARIVRRARSTATQGIKVSNAVASVIAARTAGTGETGEMIGIAGTSGMTAAPARTDRRKAKQDMDKAMGSREPTTPWCSVRPPSPWRRKTRARTNARRTGAPGRSQRQR